MYASLLETSKPLLQHKRRLVCAGVGLTVMGLSFGAGLGLLLPVFNFLLKEGKTLGQIIEENLNGPFEQFGDDLAGMMPTDPFYGFMLVMITILVMTTFSGLGRFLHTYMIVCVTSRVIQFWRVKLYRKMVHMDMTSFWKHGIADGSSRIVSDIEYLRGGYYGVLVRSTQAGLKVISAMTVAFIINWQLTLLAMIGGPLIAVVIRKFGKSVRKAMTQNLEAQAEMLARMNESLSDLRVIKMSQSEGTESRYYLRSSQKAYREQVRQHRARAVSSIVVELIAMAGVVIVAGFSAYAVYRQGVPASQFMMILSALVYAGASFKPLSNLHHDLTAADAASKRILEMEAKIGDDEGESPGELPKLLRHSQSIQFKELSYSYPGTDELALNQVELEIGFGQFIAIVGGNGSGKSTLVAALTRIITPTHGKVLIDGKDIFAHDLRSVRGQMAMVSQKTRLFKGTIAQNIAYGRSWARQEDIVAAAKAATADLFIDKMPNGYETLLGEGGEGVSGGQAQRICIARAILRKPAILILDEATSQVDTTSESLISEAMEQITQGRTMLVIAHRMSTIVNADTIIVMEQGRIVGQGKHDELLKNCPEYQALAKGQFTKSDDSA